MSGNTTAEVSSSASTAITPTTTDITTTPHRILHIQDFARYVLDHASLSPAKVLKFLGGTDPAKGGWHTGFLPGHYVVQFARPVALSRLALYPVNVMASPRVMLLSYDADPAEDVQLDDSDDQDESDDDDGDDGRRWIPFAKIVAPDKNRTRVPAPANGNPNEGLTHFDAYFWGDDAIDPVARPDVLPLKNRVLAYPPSYDDNDDGDGDGDDDDDLAQTTRAMAFPRRRLAPLFGLVASRRWKLRFLKEGAFKDWIGVNEILFYGYDDPAPAPRLLRATPAGGDEAQVTIVWEYAALGGAEPDRQPTGFRVLMHHGGPPAPPHLCADLPLATCAATAPTSPPPGPRPQTQTYSVTIAGLPPSHVVAFSVVALFANSRASLPSAPSRALFGSTVDPSLLLALGDGARSDAAAANSAPRTPSSPPKPSKAASKSGGGVASLPLQGGQQQQPKQQQQQLEQQRARLFAERALLARQIQSEAAAADAALASLSWPAIERQREDDIAAVLCGASVGFAAAAGGAASSRRGRSRISDHRAARVFLSSTFVDTQAERNYIMQHGVPLLAQLCGGLGLAFELVDLRWGITDEMTDNHMTEEICIDHVMDCARTSIATAFVLFSGERYGWRNLPRTVEASKLDAICAHIADRLALDTIAAWYVRDDNALPARYILQNVSSNALGMPFFDSSSTSTPGAQSIMQNAIWQVLRSNPGLDRAPWFYAITEREATHGILSNAGSGAVDLQCLAIRRTFSFEPAAATEPSSSSSSPSPSPPLHPGFFSQGEDAALQQDLWRRVNAALPAHCVTTYTPPWRGDRGTTAATAATVDPRDEPYLRDLCAFFVRSVGERVKLAAKHRRLLSPVEREALAHVQFAADRCDACFGRDELKKRCVEAVLRTGEGDRDDTSEKAGKRYAVIHGSSGSGKTSLVCYAAVTVSLLLSETKQAPGSELEFKPVVIVRMCGTTAESSTARALMMSVSSQIRQALGAVQKPTTSSTFQEVVRYFHETLQLATADRPIYLFIDSLDQLNDESFGRSQVWSWLPHPDHLPDHTNILVSVLEDTDRYRYGILPTLKLRLQDAAAPFIPVPLMDATESMDILLQSLRSLNRTITPEQQRAVETSLPRGGGSAAVSALHIRLLSDTLAHWPSSHVPAPDELPRSVHKLVKAVLLDINEKCCGPFVRLVMQLMLVARDGVSMRDLADMVSTRDEVLGKQGQADCIFQYNEPPIRYVPPLVFANWRKLTRDFIIERGVNGVSVLTFFHRQFLEVAEELYLPNSAERAHALNIHYEYFSGRLAQEYAERNISPQPLFFKAADNNDHHAVGLPNRPRLREAVNALIDLGASLRAAREACSLEYIQAKFTAGSSFGSDLLNEILAIEELLDVDIGRAEEMADPADAALLEELRAAKRLTRDFYLFVFNNFQLLVVDPGLCVGIAWNYPAGSTLRVAAEAARSNQRSKNPIGARPVLQISHVHNSSSSKASQGTLNFDATLERESLAANRLMDIQAPPDASIFTVVQRARITLYHRRSLQQLFVKLLDDDGSDGADVPNSVRRFWTAAAVSTDARFLAAAASDGSLHIARSADGEDLAVRRNAHSGWITAVDWAPHIADTDATDDVAKLPPRLATAGTDCVARVWSLRLNQKRAGTTAVELSLAATLAGHTARVTCVRFSPSDPARIATCAADGRAMVWRVPTDDGDDEEATHAAPMLLLVMDPAHDFLAAATCVQWCPALPPRRTATDAEATPPSPSLDEELAVSYDRQRLAVWPVATAASSSLLSSPRLHIADANFAEVNHCAVSPDGRELLAVGGDRCGRVFDRATGDIVAILLDHSKPVSKCDWDGDLTISHDGTLKVWQRSTLSQIDASKRSAVDVPPTAVLAVPWLYVDSTSLRLAVCDKNRDVVVYEVEAAAAAAAEAGKQGSNLKDHHHDDGDGGNGKVGATLKKVNSAKLKSAASNWEYYFPSFNGNLWAVLDYGSEVRFGKAGERLKRVDLPNGACGQCAAWPTKKKGEPMPDRFAIGFHARGGSAVVVDSTTGQILATLPTPSRVDALCFFADNTRLACVGPRATTVWDVSAVMLGSADTEATPTATATFARLAGFEIDASRDGRRAVVLGRKGPANFYEPDGAYLVDLVSGEVTCEIVDDFGGGGGGVASLHAAARNSLKFARVSRDGRFAFLAYRSTNPRGRPTVCVHDLSLVSSLSPSSSPQVQAPRSTRVAVFVSPFKTEFSALSVHRVRARGSVDGGDGAAPVPVFAVGDEEGRVFVVECA
ncbi:hypothetical protein DFJ73DRAFT_902546 [Zopfochytrium polystomum]|nr:hypothetical protein DFJ73DRAFT_902546 [Zopfochytrium polystomum]